MKYKSLGSAFNRIFRNDLNENFENVDKDIRTQKERVDTLIVETPQPSEVVDARLGFPVLRDKLEATDAQLAQTAEKVFDYTLTPQSPKPQKNGVKNCTSKIIHKNTDNELQIVQKTNKGYVHYTFTKNLGASGASDYGLNHELIRLTKALHLQEAYVYYDIGTHDNGELPIMYNSGLNNTIESTLFRMPQVDNTKSFSSKGNGHGFACYNLAAQTEVTYSIKSTKTKKGNILFLCTTGGSSDVQIFINNILVKSFNPRSYTLTGTNPNAMALIDFEIPSRASGDEVIKLKIRNNASTGASYPCCINFYELKDYNGQTINQYKCFGSARGGWIENAGASDYALYDRTAGKWFGSYHGGEVSEYDRLLWNTGRLVEETDYDNAMTQFSSIPTGEWRVQKHFKIYQQTSLAEGKAKMVSEFDFNVDGTVEMDFGYYDGQVNLSGFYTALTSTATNFRYLMYPKYHVFNNTPSQTYYTFPITEGKVTQVSAVDVLQLDIRFTKFNNNHDTRGATIFDHPTYRKFYYGPIYGVGSKTVKLGSLTFSKGLDFIVR